MEFLIFPYQKHPGESRISLNPREIPTKSYINPIEVALEYKEALDSGKYRNQAHLAKSLNVTPSRINQDMRLLRLPEEVKKKIGTGNEEYTERRGSFFQSGDSLLRNIICS